MKTKSQELYDSFAPYYRNYSKKKHCYLDSVDSLVVEEIRSFSKTGIKWLDVGTGDGVRIKELLKRLPKKSCKVDLVENSVEMAKTCEENFKKPHLLDISSSDLAGIDSSYDVITCLWNVFGHIDPEVNRASALKNLAALLGPTGKILIDVSNRYNLENYGESNFTANIEEDIKSPSPKNGDIYYPISVSGKTIDSFCHFFSPFEIKELFLKVNLKIKKELYITYDTGKLEKTWLRGHLFFVLQRG